MWNRSYIFIFMVNKTNETPCSQELASKCKQYCLFKHFFFFKRLWKYHANWFLKGFGQRIYISNFWVDFPLFMLNLSTGWKFVIYGSAAIQYSYPQVILFYESLCYTDENHYTSNNYFLESLYDISKCMISCTIFLKDLWQCKIFF